MSYSVRSISILSGNRFPFSAGTEVFGLLQNKACCRDFSTAFRNTAAQLSSQLAVFKLKKSQKAHCKNIKQKLNKRNLRREDGRDRPPADVEWLKEHLEEESAKQGAEREAFFSDPANAELIAKTRERLHIAKVLYDARHEAGLTQKRSWRK